MKCALFYLKTVTQNTSQDSYVSCLASQNFILSPVCS
jgi:hypothetical protein